MENTLWKIFENVNSWLKYAESKNAYMLTFIGVQFTALKFFNVQSNGWLILCLISLAVCFIMCAFSFFPKTVISKKIYYIAQSHEKPADTDNLLFYGHIVKYSTNLYIEKMEKRLNGQIIGNKYLEDLCAQIVINSGIADPKYTLFKISFWFMLIGQLFLVISLMRF